YFVEVPEHKESGRTFMSKGMLPEAQKLAEANVALLHGKVSAETPLIGIEPSAILSFRDEYPLLTRGELKEKAKAIAKNTFIIDEFLAKEFDKGKIDRSRFTRENKALKLHGHCHQKALSSVEFSKKILSIPENYS